MTALSGTYVAGNELVFSVLIYDATTKQLADPTVVAFSYSVNGGTSTVTEYPADDLITRSSVGSYSCPVSTMDMAPAGTNVTLSGQWDTSGAYELTGDIDVLLLAPDQPSPFG